jgi:hypothetical protein
MNNQDKQTIYFIEEAFGKKASNFIAGIIKNKPLNIIEELGEKLARKVSLNLASGAIGYYSKGVVYLKNSNAYYIYMIKNQDSILDVTTSKSKVREEISKTLSEKEKNIIDLFSTIAKPFNDGSGEKEKIILDMLKEYGAFYKEKIGIIVPSITKTKKVISSHIDLIPKFDKGFKKGNIYNLTYKNKKTSITGALDNTITNATLIMAIKELRSKNLAQDVEFVFTEGEEIGFIGMKEYMKLNSNEPFFINLDVTNDNENKHSSIEFDYPNFNICKELNNNLINPGFKKDRVNDDLDAVLSAGGQGFSYCLPTSNIIHSYKNSSYIENLVPYLDGLIFIIDELDTISSNHNIKKLSITKALKKAKTEEELVKLEEDIGGSTYFDFGGNLEKYYEETINEKIRDSIILALTEYDIEIDEALMTLFDYCIDEESSFKFEDLISATDDINKAEEIIEALQDFYIIEEVEMDIYIFNISSSFL